MLDVIDKGGIMPPLSVNGVASVGLVKEWSVKKIKGSRMQIQNVGSWHNQFSLLIDELLFVLGPRTDEIVSARNGDEAPAGEGHLQRPAQGLPRHEVFDVSRAIGSAHHPLYV
jgi:hypothetical protein